MWENWIGLGWGSVAGAMAPGLREGPMAARHEQRRPQTLLKAPVAPLVLWIGVGGLSKLPFLLLS